MQFLKFNVLLITLALGLAQSGRAQDVITQVKKSPPKASGQPREYSEWYLLESDPAPSGYSLSESQFQLEGPSSCGTTAQCLEGERTPSTSTWLFRIQGQGTGSGGPSVAVLTTKYRKIAAESGYTLTTRSPERFSSRGEFFGCFETTNVNDVPENGGPWCSISAEPPKPGFHIKSASFSLEGDRSCVGNDFDRDVQERDAECHLINRTDTQVTWQFRMMGSAEGPNPTAVKGFGKLNVTYEKIP